MPVASLSSAKGLQIVIAMDESNVAPCTNIASFLHRVSADEGGRIRQNWDDRHCDRAGDVRGARLGCLMSESSRNLFRSAGRGG